MDTREVVVCHSDEPFCSLLMLCSIRETKILRIIYLLNYVLLY